MVSRIALPWRAYRQVADLIRLPLFCFSGMLPLLGAIPARPSLVRTVLLLGVALCVHVYAGLLNDVVDLPLDRTQSWRQADPLVTGAVRPQSIVAAIAFQPPLALVFAGMVGGPGAAYLALALAFAGVTIYNLWGKRTAFPPLTDAAQGLGWAMLVAYGAIALVPAPPAATMVPCVYVVLYTLMASGIHGNLRDLANDFDQHARTTAILLGTRPGPVGPILSAGVMAYGLVLQAGLAVTLLLPLVLGWVGLPGDARPAALALVLALQVPSFAFWALLPHVLPHRGRLMLSISVHALVMLAALASPSFLATDLRLRLVLIAVFVVPLLTGRKYPESPFAGRQMHSR